MHKNEVLIAFYAPIHLRVAFCAVIYVLRNRKEHTNYRSFRYDIDRSTKYINVEFCYK
jgi:hypothetical protein